MVHDLRVAWRFLLKRRTATAATVLTLGIAVGSCTIAIGAIDNAFWRSIQSPDGASLLTFYDTRAAAPQFRTLSYADYRALRDRVRDRVDVAAFFRVENTLRGVQEPTRIRGELVSDNYFRVLGARAFAGRLTGEGDTSDPAVAVLSYDAWRLRFASDPRIVGASIQLGRDHLTVIGIAPPGFHGPAYPSEFWAPLAETRALIGRDLAQTPVPYLQTIARPGGLTRPQVQSYIQGFTTDAARDGWTLSVLPGSYLRFWPAYRTAVGQFLGIFAALAIGILIVACANVASLLLARGDERTRELAIRQALGGSRAQLFRRLAAESALLTIAGAMLGTLLAWWSAPLFHAIPMPVPAPVALTFDGRLVGIAAAISLIASLAFTSFAAWSGLRADVRHVLSASSRGVTGKALGQRTLVVAQLAIGCVMATAALLLLRSLLNVQRVDVGFDPSQRIAAQVSLSDRAYTAPQAAMFYRQLEAALEDAPQVESVGFESNAVLEIMRQTRRFALPTAAESVSARVDAVSAGYFRTIGMPIVAGRSFAERDTQETEPVIVINQTLAERLGGDPVGQFLREIDSSPAHPGRALRIVGVARDAQYNGITEAPQPYVYFPTAQSRWAQDLYVYVHARMPPAQAIALVRSEVRRLDPQIPLTDAGTLNDRVANAQTVPRSSAIASTALAVIAVFLALVGVYAVMTTSIENRRREFAIRSALGASPSRLVRRVFGEGAVLTAVACAIGLGISLGTVRAIAGLLFGVPPRDPLSLAAGVSLVFLASAVAWVAPSRRAATVDPLDALRAE